MSRIKIALAAIALALLGTTALLVTVRAQDPVKLEPDTYKVLFENDRTRVLDITLKAGEKSAMHSHPDYLVYALTDGHVKFTFSDGKTAEVETKVGQPIWRSAEAHAVENLAKTDLHVLNIEFKEPAKDTTKAAPKTEK